MTKKKRQEHYVIFTSYYVTYLKNVQYLIHGNITETLTEHFSNLKINTQPSSQYLYMSFVESLKTSYKSEFPLNNFIHILLT